MRHLLNYGADTETRDGEGHTALWCAVREQREEVVTYLIHRYNGPIRGLRVGHGQSEGSECVMANQRAQNVTLTNQRAQNVTLTNQRARIVRGTRQILIMLPIRQVTSPEAKSPFPFLGWTFRELGLGLWTGTLDWDLSIIRGLIL